MFLFWIVVQYVRDVRQDFNLVPTGTCFHNNLPQEFYCPSSELVCLATLWRSAVLHTLRGLTSHKSPDLRLGETRSLRFREGRDRDLFRPQTPAPGSASQSRESPA